MLKKLRKKFICIAVLSFAAALLVILGIINAVSFGNITSNLDLRIDMLTRENGRQMQPESFNNGDGNPQRGRGGFFWMGDRLPDEAPFDSRYFTVTLEDGAVTDVNTGRIASTDGETAQTMAETLYGKGKAQGFTGDYRYRAVTENGKTVYYFLECSRELDTFYSFLTVSGLAAAAGLAAVTALVVVFSRMAIRPVAESYEKQKRFITDASHELKTPLAVINAANEVTELESGETEWTQSIHRQIGRLTSLTEKLVMLSRMDEESYKPTTARFDLSAAVGETFDSFAAVAQHKNKAYTAEIEDGLFYEGDENAIRQLVGLLIDNAMKYSDTAGNIAVTLKKSGRGAELRVENTAEGLKKGDQSVLFERFYRADASRNSATGGHGIGLSVAKAIVQAHRGRIAAVSPDGKKIVFTVGL